MRKGKLAKIRVTTPFSWSKPSIHPAAIDPLIFSHSTRLGRLKNFIGEHYSEPLTIEIAAKVVCLEKTYFSKFFRKKTGVCYRDWLTWIRVQQACLLLDASDRTVTEIAHAVGFNDLRTFERAFKRFTGVCPRAIKQ